MLVACAEAPPPPARNDAAPPPPPTAPEPDAAAIRIVPGAPQVVIEIPDAGPPPAHKAALQAPHAVAHRPAPSGPAVDATSAIRAHFGDVSACYAPVATKDPSIAGSIVLQWTLGRDGMPTAVAVTQDTLRDHSVAACLKERARTWRFPPQPGGVAVVRYPFQLRVQ